MEDLLFLLKKKYPSLSLSRFHLNRVVNDNNITLKLTRVRHEPTHRWGKEVNINQRIKLIKPQRKTIYNGRFKCAKV